MKNLKNSDLSIKNVGDFVTLYGWVAKKRDLGGMIFIDLRDRFEIVQLVIRPEDEFYDLAATLKNEYVIKAEGTVVERESKNKNLATGDIEVEVTNLELLNTSLELPFAITDDTTALEDTRLKYRYLDLRRPYLQSKLLVRHKITMAIRNFLDKQDFIEVETPILCKSTPEGARDYLVPSRLHPGKFYALPQAPQQFKQLLMVSGIDKYFQIAPCFRDEDSRADRTPGEFYQLDIEMAYSTQEDVFSSIEPVMYNTFKTFSNKKIVSYPFPRITYKEAMLKYGTDKPDLRNPLVIVDCTDIFDKLDLNAFKHKIVRVIATHDVSNQPRSFFEGMTDYAIKTLKAKGLAWLRILDDGSFQGPIAKFITEDAKSEMIKRTNSKPGDCIFFIAEVPGVVEKLASSVRDELGKRLNLIDNDAFSFCWITDFPMFELNDNGKLEFSHNPFSMPQGGLKALEEENPLDILAYQYDIVCNGIELSSGAVRNHDINIMLKAFSMAGYKEDEVKTKFGALYTAFQYGAPPHAGIAPGIDRMLMLLSDSDSIREVIAFPLNSKAQDLMMGAPCNVKRSLLRDVHIDVLN